MTKRVAACLLVILCLLTTAFAETQVAFSWGSTTWVKGVQVTQAVLTVPLRNCVGFTLKHRMSNVTSGTVGGQWAVYGRDADGNWAQLDVISVQNPYETLSSMMAWETPRDVYAICLIKLRNASMVKCTQTLQILDPQYAAATATPRTTARPTATPRITARPTTQPATQDDGEEFTLDEAWAAVVSAGESAVAWGEDKVEEVEQWWQRLSDDTKPLVIVVAALVLYEILAHFWRSHQRKKERKARLAAQPTTVQQTEQTTTAGQPTSNPVGNAVTQVVGTGVGAGVKYLLSKIDFSTIVTVAVGYMATAYSATVEWVNGLSEGMKLVVLVVVVLVINKIVSLIFFLLRKAFAPRQQ